ncbi:hypothetical protein STRIP9103_02461 [Streptomyces ipomoeae 91-03]|uniref:Uncharacterized protein n=1 Tax=Streptomyces ipomoeae 91-03 TaxID=698759 RepID=L1KPX7_9ACTN|nr:hypothetical protein STRIP9103_02461 [Streptomyces ipomoeae 91-03]
MKARVLGRGPRPPLLPRCRPRRCRRAWQNVTAMQAGRKTLLQKNARTGDDYVSVTCARRGRNPVLEPISGAWRDCARPCKLLPRPTRNGNHHPVSPCGRGAPGTDENHEGPR